MSEPRKYSVFGLNFSSQLEIPELPSALFDRPDVRITLGTNPEQLPDPVGSAFGAMIHQREMLPFHG